MVIKGDVARYLSGMPILIPDCNIAVTQPTIRDICAIGEESFLLSLELFTGIEKVVGSIKEGNSQLERYDDFQVLLVMLHQDKSLMESLQGLFSIIFPDYLCQLDNGCINFRKEKGGKIVGQVNPRNFDGFKDTLRELFMPSGLDDDEEEDFNPVNDAAAAIAEKLKEARRKRAEMKKKEEGDRKQSLFATYASTLSVGLGVDVNVFFGYTPFQLYDAFTRYTKKMSYDLYQKVATTPLMDASKMDEPDNWIGSIY